jgi:hypothetical protein
MSDLLTASERDALVSLGALQDGISSERWKLDLGHVLNCQEAITAKRLVYFEIGKYAPLADVDVEKIHCLGDLACEATTIVVNRTPIVSDPFKLCVNLQIGDNVVEFEAKKLGCWDKHDKRVSRMFFMDLPKIIAKGGSIKEMMVDSRLTDNGRITVVFRIKTPDGEYVTCTMKCRRMRALPSP